VKVYIICSGESLLFVQVNVYIIFCSPMISQQLTISRLSDLSGSLR